MGAGAVFLSLAPENAVLSDINKELIDCIKTVCENPDNILQLLSKTLNTKEFYYKMRSSKPRSKASITSRFIYLNRTCWGGIYRLNKKGEFNVPFGNNQREILSGVNLKACAELFSTAKILCSDFENIISMANKGDVIYIDPPYTLSNKNNGFLRYNDKLFSWNDQKRLALSCEKASSRGVFIAISGFWHNDLFDIYKKWWAIKLPRKSLVSRTVENRREINEILLFNRKPRNLDSTILQSIHKI